MGEPEVREGLPQLRRRLARRRDERPQLRLPPQLDDPQRPADDGPGGARPRQPARLREQPRRLRLALQDDLGGGADHGVGLRHPRFEPGEQVGPQHAEFVVGDGRAVAGGGPRAVRLPEPGVVQ
ncbi:MULTISPECIES: hypothetical protein [Streptomyces]|uniref:Uncharacterized protein n=1 Tax=Streptomyces doudnae TaxID=3075536 RepID=A0ABD5EW55_9ACTN|nr:MULTISPECIES: hypothetical protein [unclassified Streptomyces]MDT0438468.1 hypothetical protein [Streptomyces sp. DSM 41981]MYQ62169.1 hypothetical protein [Streptomyces sp. SID4950]